MFRITSQIPLKRCPGAPAHDSAADGAPGGDDDVDAAVGVWVFGSRVGGEVSGLAWPGLVLPDHEGLVEGVEARASGVRGDKWEGLLVTFAVCEV